MPEDHTAQTSQDEGDDNWGTSFDWFTIAFILLAFMWFSIAVAGLLHGAESVIGVPDPEILWPWLVGAVTMHYAYPPVKSFLLDLTGVGSEGKSHDQ